MLRAGESKWIPLIDALLDIATQGNGTTVAVDGASTPEAGLGSVAGRSSRPLLRHQPRHAFLPCLGGSCGDPQPPAPLPHRWLRQNEAADYLGVTVRTIRNYIDGGLLTGYRLGDRSIRVDVRDLDKLMRPARGRPGDAVGSLVHGYFDGNGLKNSASIPFNASRWAIKHHVPIDVHRHIQRAVANDLHHNPRRHVLPQGHRVKVKPNLLSPAHARSEAKGTRSAGSLECRPSAIAASRLARNVNTAFCVLAAERPAASDSATHSRTAALLISTCGAAKRWPAPDHASSSSTRLLVVGRRSWRDSTQASAPSASSMSARRGRARRLPKTR